MQRKLHGDNDEKGEVLKEFEDLLVSPQDSETRSAPRAIVDKETRAHGLGTQRQVMAGLLPRSEIHLMAASC
jgi:hypothetical protein